MKRKITLILTCAGIAGAMVFASCKKDDSVSKKDQTLDSLMGKATISGVIYLDNDQTQKVAKDEVASGAIVTISYDTKDLAYRPDSNAISYNKIITTTTDATGKFSVTLDANTNGVNYTVEVAQFFTKYTRYDGVDSQGNPIAVSNDAYFEAAPVVLNLKSGQSKYTAINMGGTPAIVIPQ